MASNPYVNKVEFGNSVLLDLTSDTATADKVASGYTFHLASGQSVTGTASYSYANEELTVPSWAVALSDS